MQINKKSLYILKKYLEILLLIIIVGIGLYLFLNISFNFNDFVLQVFLIIASIFLTEWVDYIKNKPMKDKMDKQEAKLEKISKDINALLKNNNINRPENKDIKEELIDINEKLQDTILYYHQMFGEKTYMYPYDFISPKWMLPGSDAWNAIKEGNKEKSKKWNEIREHNQKAIKEYIEKGLKIPPLPKS